MSIVDKARMLRSKIEELAVSMDDSDALDYKDLFAVWDGKGHEYAVDDRVRYQGVLYKVLQAHTSQPTWNPVDAPSLFAKVLIPDPGEIPVWEQPSSTNPYMKGDKVHFPTLEDPVYESLIDNNVWSPADYPAGWGVINEE